MQLIVFGMHRSGTSTITRLLNMMGVYVGEEKYLMRPAWDNPHGFMERNDVVAINDEILDGLGCSWCDLGEYELLRHNILANQNIEKKIEAVITDLEHHPIWAIKDPRLCLTFPAWKTSLSNAVGIFIYRDPLDIVNSLRRRNGFSVAYCLALIEQYQRAFVSSIEGIPIVSVSFADVIGSYHNVEKLRLDLQNVGVQGLRQIGRSEAEDLIDVDIYHRCNHDLRSKYSKLISPSFEYLQENLVNGSFKMDFSSYENSYLDVLRNGKEESSCKEEDIPVGDEILSLLSEVKQRSEEKIILEKKCSQYYEEIQSAEKCANLLNQKNEELQNECMESEKTTSQFIRENEKLKYEHVESKKTISQLIQEKGTLAAKYIESENTNRQLHLENSEIIKQLGFLGNKHQELANNYNSRVVDIEYLMGLLAGLDMSVRSTLSSWRWRIACYIGNLSRVMTLRDKPNLSMDLAQQLLDEYRKCNPSYEMITVDEFISIPKNKAASNSVWTNKDEFTKHRKVILNDFLNSDARLNLLREGIPKVSIVLILFNRAELTFACLESIKNVSEPYELIIIDNASLDSTHDLLRKIDCEHVVINASNTGFLMAVNQAAKLAAGEYLLLLNNDAQLFENAIENALKVFEEEEDVGVVGGKIILLDGSLQEAGSIIWNDGSCLGYGRGESPYSHEYMFRREVDYCSGAFFLTPTSLFNDNHGFDQAYKPAYYEETDYCMRIWAAGKKVVYEPTCLLMHYEFASSDNTTDATDLMQANRVKLLERHRAALGNHYAASPGMVLAARTHNSNRKVLVVDDRVPHVKYGSGFPRANNILKTLVKGGYKVTFYPLNFPNEECWDTLYTDISIKIEVIVGYGRERLKEFILERENYYDTVIISRPHNMEYFNDIISQLPDRKFYGSLVYDAEAIFVNRELMQSQLLGKPMSDSLYEKKLRCELDLAKDATSIFVVSKDEGDIFRENGLANVNVLGHVVETQSCKQEFADRRDYLFVGNMDYDESPNVDSVMWFINEIFPRIRENPGMADIQLNLVGTNQSNRIKNIECKGVVQLGAVDNLHEYYNEARIFIAPTRFGAGIPHKIHEAAASGIPCVITDLLLNQLGWSNKTHALSSHESDPAEFANNCFELYTNGGLWEHIRDSAKEKVLEECSVRTFDSILLDAMHEISM